MEISIVLMTIVAAFIGVVIATVFSLIPGLHIYNVIAITMILYFFAIDIFATLDPIIMTGFVLGMVVTFSVLFTVSSQYFQPADESFRSMILPHERFLLEGRAHEAVILAGIGALVALLVIVLLFPIFIEPIAVLVKFLQPHYYWILATVIIFILLTEWPKDHGTGRTRRQRFQDGWVQLLMGYFTFFAASILGILVFYRTIIPVEGAFQSLMPLFIGLFAIPSHIMALVTEITVPPQHVCKSVEASAKDVSKGSLSGILAGMFAAFNPGLTPGPALLITGHLTVQSGDRQFIIGGGAGRLMYYVGALFLFFLPGVYMRRGGAAINISLFFTPETPEQFYLIAGIIALTGGMAFLLLTPFSRMCAQLATHIPFKLFSLAGMLVLTALVYAITSWQGLLIMTVATAIGIVPNMWHTRRINLLAVLLVPIFLNMAGIGAGVANFFYVF